MELHECGTTRDSNHLCSFTTRVTRLFHALLHHEEIVRTELFNVGLERGLQVRKPLRPLQVFSVHCIPHPLSVIICSTRAMKIGTSLMLACRRRQTFSEARQRITAALSTTVAQTLSLLQRSLELERFCTERNGRKSLECMYLNAIWDALDETQTLRFSTCWKVA